MLREGRGVRNVERCVGGLPAARAGVRSLPPMEWVETPTGLEATVVFADFAAAFAFMGRVAVEAEAMGHHPDMAISWNRVTLRLTTHDAGGRVTELDRRLAARIDAVEEG